MKNLKYLINHSRFKENLPYANSLIKEYPKINDDIFNFFNGLAKDKYKLKKTICLCGSKNDKVLSRIDRNFVKFTTVICVECGLIRAKKYYYKNNVVDFYKNYYRKLYSDEFTDPKQFYLHQYKSSFYRANLIKKYLFKKFINKRIIDVGGGVGGFLHHFRKDNKLYLIDYYKPYLSYAKSKGINTSNKDLNNIKFKPDLIILSHVMEHWNNFRSEIKKLIKIQKKGKTLNYIEFPGVDSLKLGRRQGDILGDIHVPHIYYFTSYVFENIMNRYGFECIYIDSEIKSIFIYTGIKKNKKNYFEKTYKDLKIAEQKRLTHILKNLIKLFMPYIILNMIRKVRMKKIYY
jgi:SAM-dependent methyltransferase